ncbi:GvpL/GvpF family gas vesicle protein [Zooshikella harenae]|uniref:GvpL/GvpF family gas vesicle protein n=1 Tax=Zooshikella harenae TaxID=2827238 RepID=A0ABS5ZD78_9GAMM|nr:GvpL/GvpF family gas vesicle protein [Zooshikella harenae]MBU2712031.1 GvpL/GvpF family gas vesicle protein [Zooshikella harenae]
MQVIQLAPDEALYLYGFQSGAQPVPTELYGLNEYQPVMSCTHVGLTAYISKVKAHDFTGPKGEAQLQDVQWLTQNAKRHDAVLEALMVQGDVFPVTFGSLFSSLQKLMDTMLVQRRKIANCLKRVAACREWGVQGILDRSVALDVRLAEALQQAPTHLSDSPGRRHLQVQRLRRELERSTDRWLATEMDRIATALTVNVHGFYDRQRQTVDQQVLNWAFLVQRQHEQSFFTGLAAQQEEAKKYGLDLSCKGPWPPYSFCRDAEE